MKTYDEVYRRLVGHVMAKGQRKPGRGGTDILSCFNLNYELDLSDGFPLLTTKRMSWKNIVVENLWFLSGRRDVGPLRRFGVKFWDAWADERGEVPSAYGSFWRHFDASIDQVRWAIDRLGTDRYSKQVVVSAWDPRNACHSSLPPCHTMFVLNVEPSRPSAEEVARRLLDHAPELVPPMEWNSSLPQPKSNRAGQYARYLIDRGHADMPLGDSRRLIIESLLRGEDRLNLHVTQRSADMGLGLPYNTAGYAFLLSLFARCLGLKPGRLGHSIVDGHIYVAKPPGVSSSLDHYAALQGQIQRKPFNPPHLRIHESIESLDSLDEMISSLFLGLISDTTESDLMSLFQLEGYESHEPVSMKVAV